MGALISCTKRSEKGLQTFLSISSFSSFSRHDLDSLDQCSDLESVSATIVVRKAVLKRNTKSNEQFVNNYQVLNTLGKGSFAKVKLIRDIHTKQYFALKVMSKLQLKKKRIYVRGKLSNQYESVLGAIEMMKEFLHPNIVKLYEIINDDECDKLMLVLDFAEKGASLPGVVDTEPIPQTLARKYFRDLLNGLEYLHSLHIIHRDIKPENLFIMQDGSLKIGDFGAALCYQDNMDLIRQSAGTAAFLPPELCTPEETEFPPQSIDIWAAGITLWVYLFGRCPFIGVNIPTTYNSILNDPLEIPSAVSPELRDLLERILEKDPNRRITVRELQRHPWLLL